MSTLERIQSEIKALPLEEFLALRTWLLGMTIEMIADNYGVSVQQVKIKMAFYAENKAEINKQITAEDSMTSPLHV